MAAASLEAPASARARPWPLQLRAGLLIVGTIAVLAALAPWIAPHPWDTISIRTRFLPPNATYWLGTDDYGRDVLSRLLMGARLSLGMGIGATLFSVAIGVPLGLAAGYFRGWVDEVLMRAADVLMAIPAIMLGLLVLAVTPPALWKTALAVGFVYIPLIARVARSVTLGPRRRGLRAGGPRPRRGARLHPVPRDPAQRLAAADRGGEPARHLRHPAGLGAELPRARRAAAELRLGADDRRGAPVHRPRALDRARARASPCACSSSAST